MIKRLLLLVVVVIVVNTIICPILKENIENVVVDAHADRMCVVDGDCK